MPNDNPPVIEAEEAPVEEGPPPDFKAEAPNRYQRAQGRHLLTVQNDHTWVLEDEGVVVASGPSIANTADLVQSLRAAGADALLADLGQDQFWAQLVFLEALKG